MIKPDMIPDEVVNALWRNGYDFGGGLPAQRMKVMRDAIAAALNAWPGMEIEMVGKADDFIVLPMKKEAGDE